MNLSYSPQDVSLPESVADVKGRTSGMVMAFCGGMAVDLISIFIGKPYVMMAIMIILSLLLTLIWLEDEVPWMLFATMIAANPVNVPMPIAGNMMFALWLIFLHFNYMRTLPTWVYVLNFVVLAGVAGSTITWVFLPTKIDLLNQLASLVNYVLGPFLLIPMIYVRLETDELINPSVLLTYFLLPSAISILLAYFFGHPMTGGSSESEIQTNISSYMFGQTEFRFLRTQIGFLLAAFTCVTVAVLLCSERFVDLVLSGIILALTLVFFMITGSIGSGVACLGGIGVMLAAGFRYLSVAKYLAIFVVIGMVLAGVWIITPQSVQEYVNQHYTQRLGGEHINTADRSEAWRPAVKFIERNPGGIGWTLFVEEIKFYPHNDYFTYAIGYGLIGGAAYALLLLSIAWRLFRSVKWLQTTSHLAVVLAGLGVITVIILNSLTDHLSANRWYYSIMWSIVWFSYFSSKAVTASAQES